MNQPRKPKKVKAPEGCASYLTAGKEYDVISAHNYSPDYGYSITIRRDDGTTTILNQNNSTAFQNNESWIVTEWEDENN